jgi:hypothetical protein
MAMMPPEMPTMMVVVIIEERETEERQPYIGIASVVGRTTIIIVIVIIVIVVTGPPMTMPSLVTVIPAITLAAVPPVHLLDKIVAQGRLCGLDSSQTGRQWACLAGRRQ